MAKAKDGSVTQNPPQIRVRLPSLAAEQNTAHLGHFAKDGVLQAGHNTCARYKMGK